MDKKEEKREDWLLENIEKEVKVFQHFDSKSYSGKFLGYIKKIRSGIAGILGIIFIIMVIDIISIILGDDSSTWVDVSVWVGMLLVVTLVGYILIFFLQGFSIIIKNNEDQILERNSKKDENN